MQNSLSWIEWFDRLDRVLKGARTDVRALAQPSSPNALAAVARCRRQLSALTDDLRWLDRSVLAVSPGAAASDRADDLQKALDATVLQLGAVAEAPAASSVAAREQLLRAIDAALCNSGYEAAMLLGPAKRRA
jgi:hypothetical protein